MSNSLFLRIIATLLSLLLSLFIIYKSFNYEPILGLASFLSLSYGLIHLMKYLWKDRDKTKTKTKLDLDTLSDRLDGHLNKETSISLRKWLNKNRNDKVTRNRETNT